MGVRACRPETKRLVLATCGFTLTFRLSATLEHLRLWSRRYGRIVKELFMFRGVPDLGT